MDEFEAMDLMRRYESGRAKLDCDDGMKKIWEEATVFSGSNLPTILRTITYEGIRAGRVWEEREM